MIPRAEFEAANPGPHGTLFYPDGWVAVPPVAVQHITRSERSGMARWWRDAFIGTLSAEVQSEWEVYMALHEARRADARAHPEPLLFTDDKWIYFRTLIEAHPELPAEHAGFLVGDVLAYVEQG